MKRTAPLVALLCLLAVACSLPPQPGPGPDPQPLPNTITRAQVEAIPAGATVQQVVAALGQPVQITPIDGVDVYVYPLDVPPGAVAEIRLRAGRVVSINYW